MPIFQTKEIGARKQGGTPMWMRGDYLRGIHQNVPYTEFREDWLQKPGINADLVIDPDADSASALVAYEIANRNFELKGTTAGGSMATANCTFRVGGGITLTTGTTADDYTVVAPHLDTDQTALSVASFLSQKSPRFEAYIETGASIAATKIIAGFKLTDAAVLTTDASQAMFWYDSASTLGPTKWHFVTSRTNVDVDVVLDAPALVASTLYRLVIEIDANRYPHAYINGKEYSLNRNGIDGTAAMVTAISYIPYIGVRTTTTAAKSVSVLPGYLLGRVAA